MQGAYDNEVLIGGQLGLGQARDASGKKRAHSWLSMATETHAPLKFSMRFLLTETGWGRPQQIRITGKQKVGDKVNWRNMISGRRTDCISLLCLFFLVVFVILIIHHPCDYNNDNSRCIFFKQGKPIKIKGYWSGIHMERNGKSHFR